MKNIVLSIIATFISFHLFSQQPLLQLDDNLWEYSRKYPTGYASEGPRISNWKEGKITLLSYSQQFDAEKPILILIDDRFLVGALQVDSAENYIYYLDTDGDGILDYKSEELILPYTIFFYTSSKSSEENVIPIFNHFFSALSSHEGPFAHNEFVQMARQEMKKFMHDTSLANRDLLYLLNFTIEQLHHEELTAKSIQLLERHYYGRYEKQHPLILYKKAELLMLSGQNRQAINTFKQVLIFEPDCIPARYHLAKLKNDSDEIDKIRKLAPEHWILKE